MDSALPAILVLDASVLINFLCVNRADLIRSHPAAVYVTEHVRAEVTAVYQEQLARLDAAIADGTVRVVMITDVAELAAIAEFRGRSKKLGLGECSAIVAAVSRGWEVAIDDNGAIKHALALHPTLRVHRTQDLVVQMIREGILDMAAADRMKLEWEKVHRFKLKFQSFADLLH